ncbi:hypothetical protein Vafri_7945 [Volvox africanus]|uniref:Uncharacterized protein n=1 Tax=Volvox africanus TaxID=51714 RepID=A0A8J4B1M6_9CHLO|nr:hypothetical protein Vafri_7945 [Volvox africanus]
MPVSGFVILPPARVADTGFICLAAEPKGMHARDTCAKPHLWLHAAAPSAAPSAAARPRRSWHHGTLAECALDDPGTVQQCHRLDCPTEVPHQQHRWQAASCGWLMWACGHDPDDETMEGRQYKRNTVVWNWSQPSWRATRAVERGAMALQPTLGLLRRTRVQHP